MTGIEEIWSNPSNPFCLCVGAGVTMPIVGSWTSLLGKLAKMRHLTRWKGEVGDDRLDHFFRSNPSISLFPAADVLEQGEYLLADMNDRCKFINTPYETRWREQFFMEQVHVLIERSITDYITKDFEECKNCLVCEHCLMKDEGYVKKTYSGIEMFPQYFVDVQRITAPECKRKEELSTLSAVIALCLSGSIQQLVVYNFDDIIERLISSTEVRQFYGIEKEVRINVYSYGGVKEEICNNAHYYFGTFPLNYGQENNDQSMSLSLYHVHGIVTKGITPIPLVFSEHSYIEYREMVFNWSNQILIELLTRFNLMTVGFSGTDSNFRTLTKALKDANENLMFGTAERMNHVILTLVTKNYLDKLEKEAKGIEPDIKKILNSYYMDMVNGYYEKYFGIEVWWLPTFPDLASRLLLRCKAKE